MQNTFLEQWYGVELDEICKAKEQTSPLQIYKKALFARNEMCLIMQSKEGLYLEELFLEQVHKTKGFLQMFYPNLHPVSLMAGYRFLLENGYLSEQHQFTFRTKNYKEVPLLGASISTGNGCCRNISDFLGTLFTQSFIKSMPVYIKMSPNIISPLSLEEFQEVEEIEPSHFEEKLQNSKLVSYIAPILQVNHVIVEASYCKQNYFFDATSRTIFYETEKGVISPLGKEEQSLFYFQDLEAKPFPYLPQFYKESTKELYQEAYQCCQRHKDDCESFYQENKTLWQEESRTVSEIYQKTKKRW